MTETIYNVQDSKAELCFHLGQSRVWKSERRYQFILAGTQSGKTSFGPWWLYREIQRCGAGDYLAVAANYDLFKLKMLPELNKVLIDLMEVGRYHPSLRVIEIRDPETGEFWAKSQNDEMYARIILRSARAGKGEVGVSGLESATAQAAWLDEVGLDEFSLSAWEAVKRRLSLSRGRVLGTTTIYNFGWLYSEIYIPWKNGDTEINVVQFESTMNPSFPKAEFEDAKKRMPLWRFNMMYKGLFDRPAGMIYQDFDESVHVIEPFIIPPSFRRVVGVDPGAINTATVWLALGDDDIWYLYSETLEGNLTSKEHVERVKTTIEEEQISSIRVYGGSSSEKQFRMDWQTAGISVLQPPVSDVEAGIDRVTELLKTNRLRIFRSCPNTIDQLKKYSRKVDHRGETMEAIKDKEKYHYLDALRYAVSNIAPIAAIPAPVSSVSRIPSAGVSKLKKFM